MPLNAILAARGSSVRLACYATRLTWPAPLTVHHQQSRLATRSRLQLQLQHRHLHHVAKRATQFATSSAIQIRQARRCYSDIDPAEADFSKFENLPAAAIRNTDEDLDEPDTSRRLVKDEDATRCTKQHGSMRRKKRRMSRPATVLQSIQSTAQELYRNPAIGRVDLSYRGHGQFKLGGLLQNDTRSLPTIQGTSLPAQPVTLYSILARYLDHRTGPHWESEFAWTALEQEILRQASFTQASVESWAACLLEQRSTVAANVFGSDKDIPPLFLLLLFLRRRYLNASAVGIVMRHVDRRVKSEPLAWAALKILTVRLLRHARNVWPESTPWISSLFVAQTNAVFGESRLDDRSHRMLSDLTNFCNMYLLLLSLPASINPVLSALHQEKAQFQILQFMASHTPPITVTRRGFRAVSRNQLAHAKTDEERDWAELKGPSWPPWKENRTAMDEDKGYEYGASRASRILHRMYEAGYTGQKWEEMVEIYAGWDTDLSPTIQTRTSLPHLSSQVRDEAFLTDLLWAGRVRTTRTRREAWACFLACELSGTRTSQQVYLAMFEKLHQPALRRSTENNSQPALDEVLRVDEGHGESDDDLLPGDMREVVPDPTSPLHYVYLSEPVPTFKELCHRMYTDKVYPTKRLLSFLVEVAPTFEACVDVLDKARKEFNGGIDHLLSGHHGDGSSVGTVPGYLLTSFIKMLCRYGHFHRTPHTAPPFQTPTQHGDMFHRNKHYLLQYAYSILMHYRPRYRPAWVAYMEKVVRSNLDATTYNNSNQPVAKGRGTAQYVVVWKLIEAMEQVDLDVDDEMFNLVCMATTYAAQAVNKGTTSHEGARHVLQTGSPRLRKMFHNLVGANMDSNRSSTENSNSIPPHIPGPAGLHAYVRALGSLRDYEGLYSFSTWLTRHHVEVTARAEAQHSGSKLLFRTLVALRAAVTGYMQDASDLEDRASDDIVQLIKAQIDSVEGWGGWPGQEHVDLYAKGGLKSDVPSVGGR